MDEIQICDFIKVLVDCPSNHNDGFLAILNMKTKDVQQNDNHGIFCPSPECQVGDHDQWGPLETAHRGFDTGSRAKIIQAALVTTGERPLTGQLREAQKIADDISSGQLFNSGSEHITRAFQLMAPTDLLDRDRRVGR